MSLHRNAALQRAAFRSSPSARRRAELRATSNAKKLLWVRSGGWCEMCGNVLFEETFEYAHRRQVGTGGRGIYTASNGLASCPGPTGCNQRCSADAEYAARGRADGWIISRFNSAYPGTKPARVYHRGVWGWYLLHDDGSATPYHPETPAPRQPLEP